MAITSFVFMNTTLYVDDRRPFIDDEAFSILMLINPATITCGISIAGIVANITAIATFIKLGFKETINISLTTLAVTDLVNLTFLLWMCLSYNPAFCDLVCHVIDLKQIEDFIGGDPRSYFTTVGGCITGVIACERCLCVFKPLEVRTLLTKTRLWIIIPCVFVVSALPYLPIFYTTGLAWVFDPATNRSLLTRTHRDDLYHVDYVCYGLIMAFNLATYALVALVTGLIVWKLASQSRWRASQAQVQGHGGGGDDVDVAAGGGGGGKKPAVSGRDKRATLTVTVIAVMYITCFFPGRVLYLTMTLAEEFNKGMLYTNLYDFLWYFAYIGESICSSANLIVYLKTSTRFKDAFLELFCRRGPKDGRGSK